MTCQHPCSNLFLQRVSSFVNIVSRYQRISASVVAISPSAAKPTNVLPNSPAPSGRYGKGSILLPVMYSHAMLIPRGVQRDNLRHDNEGSRRDRALRLSALGTATLIPSCVQRNNLGHHNEGSRRNRALRLSA